MNTSGMIVLLHLFKKNEMKWQPNHLPWHTVPNFAENCSVPLLILKSYGVEQKGLENVTKNRKASNKVTFIGYS